MSFPNTDPYPATSGIDEVTSLFIQKRRRIVFLTEPRWIPVFELKDEADENDLKRALQSNVSSQPSEHCSHHQFLAVSIPFSGDTRHFMRFVGCVPPVMLPYNSWFIQEDTLVNHDRRRCTTP
jgi:hypothetical protein